MIGELLTPPQNPRILREQVSSLFATIREATFADAMVAMVFGAVMYWQLREPLILVWMGLHLGQTLRLPLLTAYFCDPDAPSRSELSVSLPSGNQGLMPSVGPWKL